MFCLIWLHLGMVCLMELSLYMVRVYLEYLSSFLYLSTVFFTFTVSFRQIMADLFFKSWVTVFIL